jgi:hypothetical protein
MFADAEHIAWGVWIAGGAISCTDFTNAVTGVREELSQSAVL